MYPDYHLHTCFSGDCKTPLRDVIAAAKANKIKADINLNDMMRTMEANPSEYGINYVQGMSLQDYRNQLIAQSRAQNAPAPQSLGSTIVNAFTGNNLVSIVIPNTIRLIGPSAFSNCTNLDKILFEGDAPYKFYTSFSNCPNCKAIVSADSRGWNVSIPGFWYNIQ